MSNPPPAGKVRAISLWQPWASLMACGAKMLETRSWDTAVRGQVYIHASQTKDGLKELYHAPLATIEAMEKALDLPMGRWATELPFGKIIARGDLINSGDAWRGLNIWPEQEPFGNFERGRFAHVYHRLKKIEPVPYRGSQGFFFATLPPTPK